MNPDSGRPGTWACAGCAWEGEARDAEDAAWQHGFGPFAPADGHAFSDADAPGAE